MESFTALSTVADINQNGSFSHCSGSCNLPFGSGFGWNCSELLKWTPFFPFSENFTTFNKRSILVLLMIFIGQLSPGTGVSKLYKTWCLDTLPRSGYRCCTKTTSGNIDTFLRVQKKDLNICYLTCERLLKTKLQVEICKDVCAGGDWEMIKPIRWEHQTRK